MVGGRLLAFPPVSHQQKNEAPNGFLPFRLLTLSVFYFESDNILAAADRRSDHLAVYPVSSSNVVNLNVISPLTLSIPITSTLVRSMTRYVASVLRILS